MTQHLTTDAFKSDVIGADTPVLVDFSAKWCPPCQAQLPILDRVASEVGDAARVFKVDVDQEPALAQLFQVQSIPTLLVFKDGQITKRFTGLTQAGALKAALADAAGRADA